MTQHFGDLAGTERTPIRCPRPLRVAYGFRWEPAPPFRLSPEARRKLQDIKECQGRALVRAQRSYVT